MDNIKGPVILDPDKPNLRLKSFYDKWDRTIIGQPRAKFAFGQAIERLGSKRRKRNRPAFVLMALGPSGVGKSASVEVLAEYLFGDKNSACKISGQDFQGEHHVAELRGAPPGYIGFLKNEDLSEGMAYGPYPRFSNWNIFRYDFWYQRKLKLEELLANAEKDEESEAQPTSQIWELRERIEHLDVRMNMGVVEESRLEARFRTLVQMRSLAEEDPNRAKAFLEREFMNLDTPFFKEAKEKEEFAKLFTSVSAPSLLLSLPFVTLQLKETYMKLSALYEENRALFTEQHKLFEEMQKMVRDQVVKPNDPEEELPSFDSLKSTLRGIVFIDEIGRGNPALHDALYEPMDRGMMRMTHGEEVDFSNVIIVGTANEGAEEISMALTGHGHIGFAATDAQESRGNKIFHSAMGAYRKKFQASFRGRVSKVEVYRPFESNELERITHRQLLLFMQQTLPVAITLGKGVVEELTRQSSDQPDEGARLVEKKLGDRIEDLVNRMIEQGDILDFDHVLIRLGEWSEEKKRWDLVFERIGRYGQELSEEKKKILLGVLWGKLEAELNTLAGITK